MPVYNSDKYISESIESVIGQTYIDWELIIVNDNSTDNTKRTIEAYQMIDSRIKLINLEENKGAAYARNTALEHAKGRFIAFLDADDKWKNDKLNIQIPYMLKNGFGFTFTSYEYIIDEYNKEEKRFKVPVKINYYQALKNTCIGCLTVIVDKEIIGDFRMPLVRRGQDNLTWLMILKKGHLAYGLNESLAEYRRVEGSLSNNKFKALKRQWTNYRTIIKLPLHKCLFYYTLYVVNNIKKYYLQRN
ncbi:glycosyltransferase family 2 protein [Cohnella fermenti]|uniref:Glycosyltransferase n=1 Tax=Cohnella fermenti TaxID=2565925 RepID=A0A4S4C592_9BACL|nr:glycosyltransferase [Cohnella fermenti]